MKLSTVAGFITLSGLLAAAMTGGFLYFKTDLLSSSPLSGASNGTSVQKSARSKQLPLMPPHNATDGSTILTKKQRDAYTALSGVPYPDIAEEIFAYCEAQYEPLDHKPVKVKGYVDNQCYYSGCFIDKLNRGFSFMEFENTSSRKREIPLIQGQKYRAQYMPSESAECKPWNEFFSALTERRQRNFKTKEGYCLAYIPIEEYSSEYEYSRLNESYSSLNILKLGISGNKITHLPTNEIVAATKNIRMERKGGKYFDVSLSCNEKRRTRSTRLSTGFLLPLQ